jgi:hypothetical protein
LGRSRVRVVCRDLNGTNRGRQPSCSPRCPFLKLQDVCDDALGDLVFRGSV